MLIRLPEVLKMTGLSRSALYAEIAAGRFPRQVKLTPGRNPTRACAWVKAEVEDWIAERVAERDQAPPRSSFSGDAR